jgi:pimeloyl-ACP methyl ester carboxylesterase
VFENRELGAGRKLALNIAVIPALADKPEPDPIFFLEGGPGVAATGAAEWFALDLPFRQKRDIVLIDLRGMGESNPLNCNLVGDSTVIQNYVNEMYPVVLVEECRRQLESTADLTQYTTTNAMADVDEVRRWLGYETINIFGLSYGGRAAFVYTRAYPTHVRSMVLLGPADIDSRMPVHHAEEAEKAFGLMCSDCRSDSACHRAFPDLCNELHAVVERLRTEPVRIESTNPFTGLLETVVIRADVFVEALRSRLYAPSSARTVPWLIHRAFLGDFGPFLLSQLPDTLGEPPWIAEGAYLSITGAEDAPFYTVAEAESLASGTLLGMYRVHQQRRAAAIWPRGRVPAGFFSEGKLDAPTLVIQGSRDPVVGSGRVIRHFRRGREVLIPQMAHVPFGLSNLECLFELMDRFYATADTAGLDTTCLSDMLPPPFQVAPADSE